MTDQETLLKIELILEQLRPMIALHEGAIELVKYEQGIVYVRLGGACVGCPVSQITLKMGVEQALKDALGDTIEVQQVD